MTAAGIGQILVFAVVLVALAVPVGAYMARVYTGKAKLAQKLLGPVERLLYRLFGIKPDHEQSWKQYAVAVMLFNVLGILLVYALQRAQAYLPQNPSGLANVDPRVAFNTAVSFGTNTNWQAYGGESTLSNLVQSAALGVQNFVSAATGMAILVAVIRGFVRKHAETIGSFWVDLTRSTLYILLPLSIVLAVILVHQGVPQTVDGRETATLVESHGPQPIVVGPVASQVAIKQIGTNGGGFYNTNSAHPLENPTPLSNFAENIGLLLISTALCFTFGRMIDARKQGLALLVAMGVLVAPFVILAAQQEQQPSPVVAALHVDAQAGNMEGKEVRFGVPSSALWAVTTTATSCGAVNSMHDSYSPLGGFAPLFMLSLSEVAFGGVGCGLYGMLIFAIVAVFIAGLMVGRTPELLGKKIEAYEMKMASLVILVPVAFTLLGAALACLSDETWSTALANHGPHGFSEVLYAYISQSNNNGSAFGGLTGSGTFYATSGGICMFMGRFFTAIPVLAIAGALARKKTVPPSSGTLPTSGPLFVVLLVGVVVLVGALSYIPALALGPIVEHLALHP